jgi:hypothetical protein
MAALGHWTHHIIHSGFDPMECVKWSFVTYGNTLLTFIYVYQVCDWVNPGDITAWRQHHDIQYADKTVRMGDINPHKQTLVDPEYVVLEIHKWKH